LLPEFDPLDDVTLAEDEDVPPLDE